MRFSDQINVDEVFGTHTYWEFAAEHRASGWNAWLTFAISPAEAPKPVSARPMLAK
jgi:hypothetical protein